jgi:hypothetical protein
MLWAMELLSLLVALMKAYLGVTLMLLLVALVVTQVLHLFHLAQLTHHLTQDPHQLAQTLAALMGRMEVVKLEVDIMELSIQHEHVVYQAAQQQGLEVVA